MSWVESNWVELSWAENEQRERKKRGSDFGLPPLLLLYAMVVYYVTKLTQYPLAWVLLNWAKRFLESELGSLILEIESKWEKWDEMRYIMSEFGSISAKCYMLSSFCLLAYLSLLKMAYFYSIQSFTFKIRSFFLETNSIICEAPFKRGKKIQILHKLILFSKLYSTHSSEI